MGAERGGVRGRRTARSGVDRYGNQRRSWGFAAASLLVSFGGGRSGIPACRSCAGGRLPEDRDRTTADNFGRDACAFQASPSIGAYRVVNFSLAWVGKFSLAPKTGSWSAGATVLFGMRTTVRHERNGPRRAQCV